MTTVNSKQWVVHKFGGTSVGSAECMKKCIDIISPIARKQRIAVVVSAMGGKPKVTDLLLDLVHAAAARRGDEITEKMNMIKQKHAECVNDILRDLPKAAQTIQDMISNDLKDIYDLLRAVQMMRTAHEQILELVSGYGEIWSANILAEALKLRGLPFVFLNARDVLFVNELDSIGTNVLWEESELALNQFITSTEEKWRSTDAASSLVASYDPVPLPHLVITGYIASTADKVATTLKRDGSDFSASIFGKMLRANEIVIWTDVSGVYSADPRRVPDAQIIPNVSYAEAIELAYFGAKVIHPKTMAPAIMANIPILIRNTFEPDHEGTRIYLPTAKTAEKSIERREHSVCGFTTIDAISLLNLEGTGMIGVPGIAHRLFGALKAAGVSVMFIAQASSEHSICFATKTTMSSKAKVAIEESFFYEMKQGYVSQIRVIDDCSIIAAVGDSMSHLPGVAGLFFGALGGASVNILSISQGCDERNISAVVYSRDATKALRAVHSAFLLSSKDFSVGIIGTGRVGSAFIQTLLEQKDMLLKRFGINVKIRGVTNSRKMILGEDLEGVLKENLSFFGPSLTPSRSDGDLRKSHSNCSLQDLANTMSGLNNDKNAANMSAFLNHLLSGGTPHSIVIDASTSQAIADMHPMLLKMGCHVVTANKRAMAKSLDLYNAVFSAARASNRLYMSEVTIGASLPIRTTLNDILCSGDAVHAIVGIMSVSAGVVLTGICEEGLSFTDAVSRTHQTGLFEDDAFKDLEGTEAAEKLLILAREMGFSMKLEDIDIEPLARRRNVGSWSDLGNTFAIEDEIMYRKAAEAKSRGCTLRYIQRIECNPPAEVGRTSSKATASIRLEEVPLGSQQAMVTGPVYYFAFHTERYNQKPLIVQGPLSDSANTASGILGDMLRVARSLGAKDQGPAELL